MSWYRGTKKKLINKGIKISEYQGPDSIHGKSYIFDDKLSVVGSFNMDNRSSFLSTETVVVIDSEEFADELLGEFNKLKNNSYRVGKDYKYILEENQSENKVLIYKKVLIFVLSIFGGIFKIML